MGRRERGERRERGLVPVSEKPNDRSCAVVGAVMSGEGPREGGGRRARQRLVVCRSPRRGRACWGIRMSTGTGIYSHMDIDMRMGTRTEMRREGMSRGPRCLDISPS